MMQVSSKVEGGIVGYLSSLGPEVLESLYEDVFTASTVFRSLPALAKQYILRLATLPRCEGSLRIPSSIVHSWRQSSPLAMDEHVQALVKVKSLRILVPLDDCFVFDATFHSALASSIFGSASTASVDAMSIPKNPPTAEEIAEHSKTRWETLLHYIVGSKEVKAPSDAMKRLLFQIKLLTKAEGRGKSNSITREGYNFLFSDLHSQLWVVLIGYIGNLEKQKLDRPQVLRFMFRLGFLGLGQSYSKKTLTDAQKIIVHDLVEFGVLYHQKVTSSRFYITPLALFLSSKSASEGTEERSVESKGFIVVETTFKVFAYTTSHLQKSLLKLFLHIQFSLPNVVVAKITKNSIKRAIAYGITSAQIIGFLELNGQLIDTKKVQVPSNVVDQIRLWEQEGNRLKMQRSSCLSHFSSLEEYESCLAFAKENGFLLFVVEGKQEIFVTAEGLLKMKSRISEWRPEMS